MILLMGGKEPAWGSFPVALLYYIQTDFILKFSNP